MRPFPLTIPFAAVIAVAVASACRSPQLAEVRIAAPARNAAKAEHLPGLHNVVTYTDGMICGGVPEGREGLQSLAAMGIRTVVSVDGATPDVATAAQLGLRYVHLPIGYDTVNAERRRQLAQAISNLPGPIYLHCHHGKHRSAAALGTALVLTGRCTSEQVEARMAVSGTAKDYAGLWQAVRDARPLPAEQRRAEPASFPSATKVTGLIATMVDIDAVHDVLKQAQQAGWQPPPDHPDIVPSQETARMASLLAALTSDRESLAHPADYQDKLQRSIAASQALDAAVRAGDKAAADRHLVALGKSCKDCHVVYRDK